MRDFPEGFTFGTSAAAHQVEGGNVNNDWWAWEHTPRTTCVEPSGDAIDFWHRYAHDAALLGRLGLPAHRMSLEWSRIEPAPGEWSIAALDHYRRILEALPRQRDQPLRHAAPLHDPALALRGRRLARRPTRSSASATTPRGSARALGDLIPHVCTINEPQIVSLLRLPPGLPRAGLRHAGLAHRVTRAADRGARDRRWRRSRPAPATRGGPLPPAARPRAARPDDPACVAACEELRHEMETSTSRASRATGSASSTTPRMRVDPAYADGFAPPAGAPLTAMGWELNPGGLYRAIAAAAATGLPVPRHRERHRHRGRHRAGRLPRDPLAAGRAGDRRRDRRARLPLLVGLGQLRMGRGLPARFGLDRHRPRGRSAPHRPTRAPALWPPSHRPAKFERCIGESWVGSRRKFSASSRRGGRMDVRLGDELGRLRDPGHLLRRGPRASASWPALHQDEPRLLPLGPLAAGVDHRPGLRLGQPGRHRDPRHGGQRRAVRRRHGQLLLDRRRPGHGLPRPGDDALLLRVEGALGARVPAAALRQARRTSSTR